MPYPAPAPQSCQQTDESDPRVKVEHLKHFWRTNWILLLVFLSALAVVAWFGSHMLLSFLYFRDPQHKDVELKGWMTPRYIVMTYDLPRPLVLANLGLTNAEMHGRPLRSIGRDLNMTMEEMTEAVRAFAAEYRKEVP